MKRARKKSMLCSLNQGLVPLWTKYSEPSSTRLSKHECNLRAIFHERNRSSRRDSKTVTRSRASAAPSTRLPILGCTTC